MGTSYMRLRLFLLRYQDFITANDVQGPRVLILDGGFRRWAAEFPGEVESADDAYE
jgi:hypothetical protein